ncbi:AFR306Cp [Eremothecium gossypii ATCC 10895]|uniref:AFR306Cp n=1 Tax=Eremothecium gossypii (strain ATCC 10895 / CBS 109.51 / FGSC 9923 / NRRL Y-1056) TaxID=284811 RepID=Q753K6_EREGS|nr:AFR306Cp [Eremothecium gossypii ATCC 10895]AAS53677.1 AFR306Cp [Eremothecium gossypii ATCC 10895]AEY97990.1 FAFR306Cp [Eremothecium gossypii FDAG1]
MSSQTTKEAAKARTVVETLCDPDIDADMLHIWSEWIQPECILIFLPGNPGLINFYREFLRSIHEKNPTWEIVGISHTGMSAKTGPEDLKRVYTLVEQVEHKVKAINDFVENRGNLAVKLVGHSIGAYMAQKVVVHPALRVNVEMVGLLTPTIIDIHRSPKGVQLTRISEWFPRFYEYVSIVDRVLLEWLLPATWISWLARKIIGGSDECVLQSAEKLVKNPSYVRQALGMAQLEMHQVRNQWDFQEEFIKTCQERRSSLWLLFSGHDHWVHSDTMKDIVEFYEAKYGTNADSLLRITIDEHISHSFVVKDTTKVVNIYF